MSENVYILTQCNKKEAWRLASSAQLESTHSNAPKHTPNKHVKQEGCETSRKYLRKWLKIWIMFYFEAQNDLEIGALSPIFNTPLKVAQIDR